MNFYCWISETILAVCVNIVLQIASLSSHVYRPVIYAELNTGTIGWRKCTINYLPVWNVLLKQSVTIWQKKKGVKNCVHPHHCNVFNLCEVFFLSFQNILTRLFGIKNNILFKQGVSQNKSIIVFTSLMTEVWSGYLLKSKFVLN